MCAARAAAARHAAHEINQGEKGLLAQLFAENGILWPETVEIRFVGLFDSVAAIVNPVSYTHLTLPTSDLV